MVTAIHFTLAQTATSDQEVDIHFTSEQDPSKLLLINCDYQKL